MSINWSKFLKNIITIWLVISFPIVTFAEGIKLEGIFIEAISEVNSGNLILDEIRTRPTSITLSENSFSIEADGYYVTENSIEESKLVAEDRARADARRLASEQASVYIKSISKKKNGKLTRDEIHTISVTSLHIKKEYVTLETIDDLKTQFHCHLEAVLYDSNVFEKLSSTDKEKFNDSVRRTIEIERENARINSELALLKEKYKNASRFEREKINMEIKHNEEQFVAVQWNDKGLKFYNQNDLENAIKCFNKAIEANSNYASSWNGLGYIYNHKRDFDKAIEYCYKAIEIDSNYAMAWNNLGYAYNYKGTFDKAIECYKRAIELNPTEIVPQINLGNVYEGIKNYDEAIAMYQKALILAPDYANTWNSLGYVYLHKGSFDKGIEHCSKALEFDKHCVTAWNGLAYAYNQKKKFYKAIECCRKALALSKNYANAWNNLGYACSKVNRYEDSYIAYKKAVELAPNIHLYKNNLNIAQTRIDSFKSL